MVVVLFREGAQVHRRRPGFCPGHVLRNWPSSGLAALGKASALGLGLKDETAALQIAMQALNVPSCVSF
jgi:hypothetical protein